MSADSTVALLQRIPIFARLSPAQITEIARMAEKANSDPATASPRPAHPAKRPTCSSPGDAERAAAPGQLLPPGSLIGELAMLVDHIYAATIVAKGRVHCLKITRSAMHGLMLTDPSSGRSALAAHHRAAAQGRQRPVAHRSACWRRTMPPQRTRRRLRDISAGSSGRRARWTAGTAHPIGHSAAKRKAPNPGGGVGRKKRVMRMCREGSRHRKQCLRLDGGHYR